MAITKTKLLIEISQNINTIATAVQLDGNSRFLDVCLHDKGLPIDLTEHVVRIHVRKPDGKTVFNQGEITDAAAGRCQFALTAEMLSEAKELKAQISIWNSDTEILSTNVFKILVTESLRNDEEVEASNEFGVLVVLFTEIQSALELMRELVSAFGEPGEMAETYGVDTFWEMLEHLAAGADVRQVLKENINSTMDTEEFATLDELILRSVVPHGVQEFKASGTFVVPDGVHKILVTACGGGGGGGGRASASSGKYGSGAGGGGASLIYKKEFNVTPGTSIPITIGLGGTGGEITKKGNNGGSTIIGNLVTLYGGYGGSSGTTSTSSAGIGTVGGSAGAGAGAGGAGGSMNVKGSNGGDSVIFSVLKPLEFINEYKAGSVGTSGVDAGSGYLTYGGEGGKQTEHSQGNPGGGGGGGCIGNGGAGRFNGSSTTILEATGGYGAGGGGGGYGEYGVGGNGGNGIVIIEW